MYSKGLIPPNLFSGCPQIVTYKGSLPLNHCKHPVNDLVPDDVTIGIVKDRLSQEDCANGFLLDGFPRTLVQAEALDKLAVEIHRPIDVVVNLDCNETELIRRISGRRVCKNCGTPYHIDTMKSKVEGICDVCGGPLFQRPDDNEEALKVRLGHYIHDTKPLLDYYDAKGLLK